MDPHKIVKYPLSTEKAIRLMESQNKLVFVVDEKASKREVEEAVETMFKVKIEGVRTLITNGQKRAYVKFSDKNPAINVATELGLM